LVKTIPARVETGGRAVSNVKNSHPEQSISEDDSRPLWRRVPLWMVWTFALTLFLFAGIAAVVGPVLVEVWAVQTLRGIKGVTVQENYGNGEWGGPVVYALRHHLFKPQDYIIFFRPEVPREALALLPRIRSVSSLFLYCRNLRDDDMAIVRQLPRLGQLVLTTPSLTADAFRHLEGHPVETVEFHDMTIPAGTLATISRLPGFSSMTLAGATFDKEDFAALLNHPRLRRLELHRLDLSLVEMETISSLPALGYLNLDRAGVTNEELARLPATLHLKSLILIGTELTDEGLAGLRVDPQRLVILDTGIEMGESTEAWLRSRIRCRKIELYNHGISAERVRYLNTLGPARVVKETN
jgi:hypothetical protein